MIHKDFNKPTPLIQLLFCYLQYYQNFNNDIKYITYFHSSEYYQSKFNSVKLY